MSGSSGVGYISHEYVDMNVTCFDLTPQHPTFLSF